MLFWLLGTTGVIAQPNGSSTGYYLILNGVPSNIVEVSNGCTLQLSEGTYFEIYNNEGDGWVVDDLNLISVPYAGSESKFDVGGTAFEVSQSGYYVFTLTEKGDGNWFVSVLYPLENYLSVSDTPIPDQTYTGSAIEPEINIETTLTLGTDYTVEYSDNTNVGTATATITGAGNYGGTIEKTFQIVPKVLGALTVTSDQSGSTATFDASSSETITITETIEVKTVVIKRIFTAEKPSTMILPFGCDASKFGGTFHTVTSVEYNQSTTQWEAKASDAVATVEANKPYIFKPSTSTTAESPITINAEEGKTISLAVCNSSTEYTNVGKKEGSDENSDWQLFGVYYKKTWAEDSKTEYGFSAVDVTEDGIAAGEFVRAGKDAWIKPMRCYLKYNGTDARFTSKSATELPQTIRVIFPDGTASVIETGDPENNGEITTPVAEIATNDGAKVWSYDGAIVIASCPGAQYQVVDINGRVLKNGVTATDRDEITLSRRAAGIVIVIVNGKTFKISY